MNCPGPELQQSEDGSACVCKPGYYPTGERCALCPKGYRCPLGVLEQCPKHYYQPREGQTDCLRCVDSASDSGFYSQCPLRGHLLKFCDPDVQGTQNQELYLQCVPCNQCRRAYVPSADGVLSTCYRDR